MTITARFASVCPRCRKSIAVGQQIEWTRGQPAVHLTCPVSTAPVAEPLRISVDEIGVYVLKDGAIVKVQPNKEKTKTYAKRWTVIGGQRLTEAFTRQRGEYVFEPGLVQQVAAEGRKMTLEEAKQFIIRYGQCCRCGRHLKDATSVERGIGPVCIKYFSAGTTGAEVMTAAAKRSYADVFGTDECRQCAPFPCDDPDRHLGVPERYTPLANRGCHCGADFDGRDCMCFEGE